MNWAIFFAMIGVYHRKKLEKALPAKSVLSMLIVASWLYLYDQDPIVLPIGIMGLYLYSEIKTINS